MCGIIGAISKRDITGILLEGLRRLEYRGYDSAGIAIIDNAGHLACTRVSGKVELLEKKLAKNPLAGHTGIAHTRWATHGKPTELNAHPHISNHEIAIVHNGIIENHEALRTRCKTLGYVFNSETDTEVAAHLIHHYYQQSEDLLCAVQRAARDMDGAFSLGVIHQKKPDQLVAIRKGSPLIVGLGVHEHFIASDGLALRGYAQSIIYLDDEDSICITSEQFKIYDKDQKLVERHATPLDGNADIVSKQGYRHYMLKEIFEQGQALADTCEGRLKNVDILRAGFGEKAQKLFNTARQIHIVACGTSYHAGMVAKYWIESLGKLPCQVEIASEYRYRDIVVPNNTLFITISQSGETADTIAALRKAKSLGYMATLSICNVAFSTLTRESDSSFLTRCGVEIGVASTKAFTTQLAALLMLAVAFCKDDRADSVLSQLHELPRLIQTILKSAPSIEQLSKKFIHCHHMLFLGRGVHYPIALEGALKMKELSYIHAEGYPAGELKHGPLALVDKNMPVIAIAPQDELLSKLKSNLHEISAREGCLYVFTDNDESWNSHTETVIPIPSCGHWIAPIVYTIPLQLLSYHVACLKGTDVDQPRNLAKSVTVE